MKKSLSFRILHRAFGGGVLLILGGLIGFMVYLYFAFGRILTGDVPVELSPDLLANLQAQRFETAVGRLQRRTGLPDIPEDLPDPYDPPSRAQ